jgi:aromatic ring-opening dioxygenase catalytic subunit (LigB family)
MADMKAQMAQTVRVFGQLPQSLPATPKAVLVVTAHWESGEFSVSSAEQPPMLYDYSGFPAHTYQIKYPAAGSPALAARVRELLTQAGIQSSADAQRGFDHGTFIPMGLIYPDAQIPVVMLSIKAGYDPLAHIRAGQALQALRDEGVLIIGSGLSYHNMRGFGRSESRAVSEVFEGYLNDAVSDPDAQRRIDKLLHWESAPGARAAHPHEDHLIPLMVVAGAAGTDPGQRLLVDHAMNVAMASYRFG